MSSLPAQSLGGESAQQGTAQQAVTQYGRQTVNWQMNLPTPVLPTPPHLHTPEAVAQYIERTLQYPMDWQEAERTRDYWLRCYGMEQDVFGFVRAGGPRLAGLRQSRSYPPLPTTYGATPYTSGIFLMDQPWDETGAEYEQLTRTSSFNSASTQPEAGPIISENDPEFRDTALRLLALQRSMDPGPMGNSARARRGSFRPSHMALEAGYTPLIGEYLGGRCRARTEKPQVDNQLNCALWVSKIDPKAQMSDIFQQIRTGAVFYINLRPPTPPAYNTAGADICWMTHSAAQQFFDQIHSPGGIWILNSRISARWNDHGELEKSYPGKSRVLRISGPAAGADMSQQFWEKFFTRCVKYQLSHFHQVPSEIGTITVEVGFARLDAQAQAVYKAIEEEPLFQGVYMVCYAPDPCAPGQPFP